MSSRNGLLRIHATEVAIEGLKCRASATIFPGRTMSGEAGREIATAYYREFLYSEGG
jgi:hypothetical protein